MNIMIYALIQNKVDILYECRKLNKALNRNNTLLKMLRDDYFNDTK